MKKLIILFVSSILLSNSAYSQDSLKKKINEFHVAIDGVTPVNVHFTYKRQIGKTTYFKLGLINLSYSSDKTKSNNSGSFESLHNNYSGGLGIGIEFRKDISKRFTFYNGPNIGATYLNDEIRKLDPALTSQQQKITNTILRSSIMYTLGFLFKINDNFLIGAEINPAVYTEDLEYKNGEVPSVNNSTSKYGFTMGNSLGIISLVFRP